MRVSDIAFAAAVLLVGAWAGQSLGGLLGLIIGLLVGAVTGFVVFSSGMRMVVAVPVVSGAVVGGILGRSIARVLCFPNDCASAEIVAALLAGIGTFVGVGLVAALVTRSFDEFRESQNRTSDQG